MYKKNICGTICTIIALIILFLSSTPAYSLQADELPEINASSAILIESSRGQILYGKSSSKKIHISTACKIMTAILTIEKAKLDSKVTISKEASSVSGSLLNLEAGEKYDIDSLLYAVVLTSANDAATALAEFVGGDKNKFVEMMNQKARDLKMTNTIFKNPTGLYDEGQYSTAQDLAILVRHAISNSTFDRFFSSKGMPWSDGENTKILVNSNKLFWSYDGVDGGKTGFNDENRQLAVTTATRNNIRLISIIIDAPADKVFKDSEGLLDYGFKNFRRGTLIKQGQVLKSIQVENSQIQLISKEDVYYTYPVGENFIKTLGFKLEQNIKPPVTKDKILGIATYVLNDNTRIDVNLYPNAEIYPEQGFISYAVKKLSAHKEMTVLVIILIIIELLIMIYKVGVFIKKVFSKIFRR